MQLKDALCYALLMMTMVATCIQAESKIKENTEKRLPDKQISKRIATLVIDDATPVGRVFQQPKVIYRRLSKRTNTSPRPTYGPRRTKYGPPRTLKRPGKKYRAKNGLKHPPFPYPYKKRAPSPRHGPPKRATMKSVYGPPKKNHRLYSSVGFGEPPSNYQFNNKHRSPKPSEFTRTQKPKYFEKPEFADEKPEFTQKPHDADFSSPATLDDNFSNKPFNDHLWSQQKYEPASSHLGYGEPPVDSYGAPILPNLHDLTFSTAQTFVESTSHLDEDHNFGPESRPWNNFNDDSDNSYAFSKKRPVPELRPWNNINEEPENNYAFSKKHPVFTGPEEINADDIFVTPVPDKQNQELHLNSYSDIYNFRQEEKAKQQKKKRKTYYQKNVKILNHPWLGGKIKEDLKEDIIVGGQYAEPPARHIAKFESSAPLLLGDDSGFSAFMNAEHENDMAAPISSYVNYKNSNMAFSPQNLNDVFSIADK